MALPLHAMRDLVLLFAKDGAPTAVRQKMQRAIPAIVKKMTAQGLTPDGTVLRVLVRDALFKLWRVVIPSGTVADIVRDSQDDKVVAMVQEDLSGEDLLDLTAIVESTMEAACEVAF